MAPIRKAFFAMAAFAAMAAPASAQESAPQAPPVMTTASPADKAMVQSMDQMGNSAAVPLTGDPDQDFAHLMLAHHETAVKMAKVELQYGKDPFLRQLSQQIIAKQTAEMKQMQAWQSKHPLTK